jgi:hypothetical protein
MFLNVRLCIFRCTRTPLFIASAVMLVMASMSLPKLSLAQEAVTPETETQSEINGQALQGSFGRISVNQAAGSGNAQANLAVIAVGTAPDHSNNNSGDLRAAQSTRGIAPSAAARASIAGGAFAQSSGLVSVNQTSGHGNAQTNAFLLGNGNLAVSALTDTELSAAHTQSGSTDGKETSPALIRETHIGDDAFRGSHGVVQVNQSSGVGNSSANAIVLRLPGGN